jgi:DNA polymerase I-like protein with 3'-5' exonuclease and polymerase domains
LAPWCRRRYYGEWNTYHINQEDIASIERWGKNSPIQGSGADQTKYALILIKRKIEEMGWGDRVKIVFQLHDAILTQFRENLIPEWPKIQAALMEEAACSNIPGGLIKADMAVTDHWTK